MIRFIACRRCTQAKVWIQKKWKDRDLVLSNWRASNLRSFPVYFLLYKLLHRYICSVSELRNNAKNASWNRFVENARLEGCASYLRPAVSWKTRIMFETLHKRAAKLDHRAFLFTFSLAELLDYWNRNKAWLFVSQVSRPCERVHPFQL